MTITTAQKTAIIRDTWAQFSARTYREDDPRWSGAAGAGQPAATLAHGWTDGARRLAELSQVDSLPQARAKAADWNQGDDWNPRRLEEGRAPWTRRVKRPAQGRTIVVNVCENASVDAAAMLYKALAATRIADELEAQGVPVEIVAAMYTQQCYYPARDGRCNQTTTGDALLIIPVKPHEEPINAALVASALAPWSLRNWGLAMMDEATKTLGPIMGSYGHARPIPSALLDTITEDAAPIIIDQGQALSYEDAARIVANYNHEPQEATA